MNKVIGNKKLLMIFTIGILSTSVLAKQVDKEEGKTVEAKCHIELFGGGETIHFIVINEHRLKALPQELINRSVMTQLSDKKRKIYKVTECILLNDSFLGNRAQFIDANTPR